MAGIEKEQFNQNPSEYEFQVLRFKPPPNFKLPDGWVVEEKPRPSKPTHIDKLLLCSGIANKCGSMRLQLRSPCRLGAVRNCGCRPLMDIIGIRHISSKYYYEPGTGKKFRSLQAVQRHLTGETKHYVTPKRMITENEDNHYYDPGTGKKYRSLLAVQRHLTEETKRYVTPERMISENKDTPTKTDSQRKFNLRKEDRGSTHNLSRPPEKVSWVLSGPGGVWSPFVDDTIVQESVKLKWSEAFVQSIHHGVSSGGLNG